MNRRGFLKLGSIAAAASAIPVAAEAKVKVADGFPETEEAMRAIMKEKGPARYRPEGGLIQDGLSHTATSMAMYWYYLKDNKLAVLRECPYDKTTRFYVERHKRAEPIYFPPLNNGQAL